MKLVGVNVGRKSSFAKLCWLLLVANVVQAQVPVAQSPEDVTSMTVPTPTPNPNPTPTPSPTPTATPTPTPPCPFYRIDLTYYNAYCGACYQTGMDADDYAQAGSSISNVSCLQNTLATVLDCCSNNPACFVSNDPSYAPPLDWNEIDDCIMINMNNAIHSMPGAWPAIQYDNVTYPVDPSMANQPHINGYSHITVYSDNNCNLILVTDPQTVAGCSTQDELIIQAWTSPISLVIQEGYDLEQDIVFTKFPLDPNAPDFHYAWKASEHAPLLVFDPTHTGEVTSAHQLFGNWFKGGKLVNEGKTMPWEHGYEALATFDVNSSKSVEGNELDDLSLWFDKNRDGISQKGEVIPVKEYGIKKLYFADITLVDSPKSVIANKGYEAEIKGVYKEGKSIDWWSKKLKPAN